MDRTPIIDALRAAAGSLPVDTRSLKITTSNGAIIRVQTDPYVVVKTIFNNIDQREDRPMFGPPDLKSLIHRLKLAIEEAEKLQPYRGDAKMVHTNVTADNSYDIGYEGIDDVISRMQKDRTRFTRDGWQNLRFEYQQEPYGESERIYLVGDRLETAAETNKRVKRELAAKESRERQDREEYERLSKKFGSQ